MQKTEELERNNVLTQKNNNVILYLLNTKKANKKIKGEKNVKKEKNK